MPYQPQPMRQEEPTEEESNAWIQEEMAKKYKRNMILTGIGSGLLGFAIGAIVMRLIVSIRKQKNIQTWAKVKTAGARGAVSKKTKQMRERASELWRSGRRAAARKLRRTADRIDAQEAMAPTPSIGPPPPVPERPWLMEEVEDVEGDVFFDVEEF